MLDGVNTNKKTAVLVYDFFCNFEISVALELWALGFGKMLGIDIPGENFGIK